MRILGIDPGLNCTGYAVLESRAAALHVIDAGVVRSKASGEFTDRLREIHAGIADVIASYKPTVVAMEELYSHYERPQTAIIMGHARGVICLAVGSAGLTLQSYAATQVKKILTGNGRASKEQMQQAICREFRLKEVPDPPDVADAMAIATCHYYLGKLAAATQ